MLIIVLLLSPDITFNCVQLVMEVRVIRATASHETEQQQDGGEEVGADGGEEDEEVRGKMAGRKMRK